MRGLANRCVRVEKKQDWIPRRGSSTTAGQLEADDQIAAAQLTFLSLRRDPFYKSADSAGPASGCAAAGDRPGSMAGSPSRQAGEPAKAINSNGSAAGLAP